ncbi:MAG: NAD-dependent epimerase/dehydratase family protein [Acidobacteriia bacterium]|nr:NAD-dependent epimerase/dehydratase family protein [Terriglobia bacterium]
MKILITGGSGFIGRNLKEQYAGRYRIVAPSRAELNLLDPEAVRTYLEKQQFDVVIHAATERSNRRLGSPPDLFENNCRMFFNLARSERYFGRMLFLSSGAVYGRTQACRVPETAFDARVPAEPYGFSKYVCAKAIAAMDRVHELRLFAVFGRYEDWQVRFISNACCRAVWNLPVVIRQNVLFDYLDVEDLGWILDCFLRKDLQHRHYNVCTGRALDLKSLAEKVVSASGKKLEIRVNGEGLGREYSGDNTRMLGEIPDFQFRGIDESIALLLRWYEERKDLIDPKLLGFDEMSES